MACPVDFFEVKRTLQYGQFVELQCHSFNPTDAARGGRQVNIVSMEETMATLEVTGKTPLPLCNYCLSKKIKPPATQASTNHFVMVMGKQKIDAKKRKRVEMTKKGYHKKR